MFANEIEAREYIQKIWYRSRFDVTLAEAACLYVDDPYIINHIQEKIKKVTALALEEAAREKNHKTGRYYVKKYYKEIISGLKLRDGDFCVRCKRTFKTYQVDHIVPLKKMGNPESMDNLQLLCEKCNKIKGER